MVVSIKKRSNSLLWVAIIVSILLLSIFFLDFFINIEKYLRSSELKVGRDWGQELKFYANIKHQVFELKKVPYHLPIFINRSNALFSNPQTSVLSPVNLLLPFVSLYNFFIYHVCFHYIIAIFGLVLLRKYFKLPYLAILPMFFLLGFNGRILSNYYIGHSMFITFLYFPLFLYLYLNLTEQKKSVTLYSASAAFVMTLIFFGGGIYLVNWIILILFFDAIFIVIHILNKKGKYGHHPRQIVTHIFPPIRNIIITVSFFGLFSAIKLLPVLYSFGKYDPSFGRIKGYKNILFFFQTFYQPGLANSIRFKELWFEEAYNFIGITAFILAIFSICYALFLAKVPTIKRLAIIGIVFSILSFGDVFHDLFGIFPFLRGIRVHGRFVFITIGILAILIPIAINHALLRLKANIKFREITMLVVGMGIFLRLYTESKKWMTPTEAQFDYNILLSSGNGGGIEPYFYIGLAISSISLLGVGIFLLVRRSKFSNYLPSFSRLKQKFSRGY